jgi:hypothetical protein
MNSSNSSSPIILLDTTFLCGAIRGEGINRQLLKLVAQTLSYRVVISRVCFANFRLERVFRERLYFFVTLNSRSNNILTLTKMVKALI